MINDIQTVFVAELLRRIRSRPFIIGMLIGVVSIMALSRLPAILDRAFGGSTNIIVVGEPRVTAAAMKLLKSQYQIKGELTPREITSETLKDYDAAAAFVVTEEKSGLRVTVLAHDPGSMGQKQIRRVLLPLQLELVTGRTSQQIDGVTNFPVDVRPVASKFSTADQAETVRNMAYTLIFFLYILILLNSQIITSSVAEEKTSRIAELLVASVDPVALLAGKIFAGAVLALLQMLVWIGAAMVTGQGASASSAASGADTAGLLSLANLFDVITPAVLVAFLVFFLIGFLQISTLFASMASLINRTEDLGSITGPLALPVVVALFIAIYALGMPESPAAVVTSMIPIISPFVMFARIAVSTVPLWQLALSLAINLAALYLIAILAGKIYRVGMLLYGRAPKLAQVWAVIRS